MGLAACGGPAHVALEAEVTELLHAATDHATRSSACVDGRGEIASVDGISLGMATHTFLGVTATIAYTAVVRHVGDTRGCGRRGNCAEAFPTERTSETMTLRFRRAWGGYRLVVPDEIPGLHLKTPLDRVHDTDCHGKRPAWRPHVVPIADRV